jgi:pyruvate dehydrogenase E2 component (dihydrolipoamide acetyltransferase)
VTEFKLPELGENISQGDLVRLMVAPGATVSAGQAVMELETDKAVVEVPSSVTGTVQEIKVKEGDKIKVGQVIFTIENGAGAKSAAEPAPQSTPKANAGVQAPAQTEGRPQAQSDAQPRSQNEAKPAMSASAPGPVQQERRERRAQPQASEFKLPELGENISQGDRSP